jgi:large subunit ribosomal protein L3
MQRSIGSTRLACTSSLTSHTVYTSIISTSRHCPLLLTQFSTSAAPKLNHKKANKPPQEALQQVGAAKNYANLLDTKLGSIVKPRYTPSDHVVPHPLFSDPHPQYPTFVQNPNFLPNIPVIPKQKRYFDPLKHYEQQSNKLSEAESDLNPDIVNSHKLRESLQPYAAEYPNFVPSLLRPVPWIRTDQPKLYPAPWSIHSVRTGLIGMKLGMMQLWTSQGVRLPITVLRVDSQVVAVKNVLGPKGTIGIQIGVGRRKLKKVPKAEMVEFKKAGVHPKSELMEFQITPDAVLPVAYTLNARHFVAGQYVDVRGLTKGKGFQGAMKRWGFAGQPRTHGVSVVHRSLGATGSRQDPGRVFKNKKMAGRMGYTNHTTQNLVVYKVDPMKNLLFLKGAVPGPQGRYITIRDAVKKPFTAKQPPPFPTYISKPGEREAEEIVMKLPEQDPFAYGAI